MYTVHRKERTGRNLHAHPAASERWGPHPHLPQVRVSQGPSGLRVGNDDLHSRENLEGEPCSSEGMWPF